MNKSLSFSLVCCCMLASVSQVGLAHQQKAAPQYYLGVTGHFDANQTYANAGSIIDEVARDNPFVKMESLESGKVRSLCIGERVSSLGDGSINSVSEFNKQVDRSKHRHGRMYVSVHSSDRDTDGEMFLVQAQPIQNDGYRLGITGAAGPNGGTVVVDVPAGSQATRLWSPTQTEKNIALEPNDEIMSINDIATPDSSAVIRGWSASKNGVATLKVRNIRTGGIETFFAEPARVNAGPKIHYVIAGQSATSKFTSDPEAVNFDRGIKLDLIHLDMLTRYVRHEFIGSSIFLQDERCTAAEIKKAVAAIDANREDTILVYFSGHGAYDQNGHFLALDGPRLYRKEIQKILKRKNCLLYTSPSPRD